MNDARARRIDTLLLGLAMAALIAAVGAYAYAADGIFRAHLIPQLEASAQSVGRETRALIVRAVEAGVPYDRLTGVSAVLKATLSAHHELAGIAVDADAGALHAQVGTIPPAPYRAFTPIVVAGRTTGTITLGIDPAAIDAVLRSLVLDLAGLLVVAVFLAAELFRLASGTDIGRGLVEPTAALEHAIEGRFEAVGAATEPEIARLVEQAGSIERRLGERFADRARIGRERVAAATSQLRAVRQTFHFDRDADRADAGLQAIRAPLFVFMLAEAMTRPFIPVVATSLPHPAGLDAAAAASAPLTVFALVVALSQPFVLPWSRRVGRRVALIVGCMTGGLGFAAAAFAPSLLLLVATRAVSGLGYGIVFAAAQGYVLDRAPTGRRAAGLAMFVSAIMGAELCGPTVGGLLAERAGDAAAFLVCAGLACVAGLLARARLPPVEGHPASERFTLRDLRRLFANPRLSALLFGVAVPQKIALTGLAFFIVPLAAAHLDQRPAVAGLLLMLYAVVMVGLTGPAAALAERLERQRTFVGAGLVLSGAAGVLPLLFPSVTGLIAMVAILGMGQAVGIASQSALVAEYAPHGPGGVEENRAYAMYRMVERFGNVIGPPIAAFVLARAGYATAAAVLGIALLVCSAWFLVASFGTPAAARRLAYRSFVLLLACAAFGGAAPRPYVVYMITYRGATDVERGFTHELAREHVDVTYIRRDVALDASLVRPLLAEIRRIHPDLIYTWGTPVTLAVTGTYHHPAAALDDIPVLFTMVADPVAVGLVPSLASSGRNVTGVYIEPPLEQQLSAMRAYLPFASVGALYTASASNSVEVVHALQQAGRREHFRVIAEPFAQTPSGQPTLDGLRQKIAAVRAAGAQWLYLPPDSFLGDSLGPVLRDAEQAGLPTFGTTQQMTQAGVLAGVVAPYYGIGELTGVLASKILVNRVAPAKIPIATLQRFTYYVSIRLADRLQRYPPLSLFRYIEVAR